MWEYCLVDFLDGNIILQDSKDKITSQFGVLSIQRFPFTLYMKPNWMFFVFFFPSKLFQLIFFSFVIKDDKIFFVSLTMNFFLSKYDLWMKSWISCDWGTILLWSSFDQGFDCTGNSYGLVNIIKQTKSGSIYKILAFSDLPMTTTKVNFAHAITYNTTKFIIKFGYNARSHWLKERSLLKKWEETLDYVSCFSLHFFRALAAS